MSKKDNWRYTEAFYSIQGEGAFTGVPSVFLRLFGCNFRCKKFGLLQDKVFARTQPNDDVAKVIENIDQYEKFTDLPIVQTGCDSYSSVYPEFKRFAKDVTTDELVDVLIDTLPNKKWMVGKQDTHLILTGGEPLLGWQKQFPALFKHDAMRHLRNVTFETNGTQRISSELKDYINSHTHGLTFTFSVSPKLSASGESRADALRPDVVLEYSRLHNSRLYLKFVVYNEQTAKEALSFVEEYNHYGITCPVYFMPVGGTYEEYIHNSKIVAELALKYGVRYSPRLHVDIFKNAWGT